MRKTISPRALYHLAQQFEKRTPTQQRHGRPRTYPFALILTIASVQNLYGLSFREALIFSQDIFTDVPCLSTFHYRIYAIDPDIIKQFIAFLGMKLQHTFAVLQKPITHIIIDGTGFSYNDLYPQKIFRGTEIRTIQSHVRALALVASTGKERFFIGAESGRAYASEMKMAEKLIPRFSFKKNIPFLGDKGFDCIRLLQIIKDRGALPCIKMKNTMRYGIKSEERKESERHEKQHGGKRTLIEGLFGNVKQKVTSHVKVMRQRVAETYALLRLALYDVYLLLSLTANGVVWVIFRTAPEKA